MPSKRPKKACSPACPSSSTSVQSGLFVHHVRRSSPASCHGLMEGQPAAFLGAGLWFIEEHFGSVPFILCSVASCSSFCSVCALIRLLIYALSRSLLTQMVVLICIHDLLGAASSAVPSWGIIVS